MSNSKGLSNTKAMTNNKAMTNSKAMTNNTTIRKSTYNSDTVLIVVGVLGLIFIIIYIYNSYQQLKTIPTHTGNAIGASCPDYWDSIGNNKCQNSKKIGSCSKIDGADVMDFSGDPFTNINTGSYAKCNGPKVVMYRGVV